MSCRFRRRRARSISTQAGRRGKLTESDSINTQLRLKHERAQRARKKSEGPVPTAERNPKAEFRKLKDRKTHSSGVVRRYSFAFKIRWTRTKLGRCCARVSGCRLPSVSK